MINISVQIVDLRNGGNPSRQVRKWDQEEKAAIKGMLLAGEWCGQPELIHRETRKYNYLLRRAKVRGIHYAPKVVIIHWLRAAAGKLSIPLTSSLLSAQAERTCTALEGIWGWKMADTCSWKPAKCTKR